MSNQEQGTKRSRKEADDSKVSSAKPVLYSYWRSSCSWRVRNVLALKGIEYDYVPVHLVKDGGEQLKPEYRKTNPTGLVPTLIIDGHTLSESRSIIEYLEETRPEPPVLPKSPYLRAKARQIADVITSGIQPIQNLRVLLHLKELTKSDEVKMAWGKHYITEGFEALEKVLVKTAGKYCVGDEITVADVCLVPQIYNAQRFAVNMNAFPTILRIGKELESHPAFQQAHPSKQPDAQ